MTPPIRHRRLHVFYQSKVLNALMIIEIVSLTLIGYMHSLLLPALCASIAFVLFIIYSLWIWIKKPRKLVINNMLSNVSGIYTLYFLVIALLPSDSMSPIWYGIPAVCAVIVMFVCMVKPSDEVFEI